MRVAAKLLLRSIQFLRSLPVLLSISNIRVTSRCVPCSLFVTMCLLNRRSRDREGWQPHGNMECPFSQKDDNSSYTTQVCVISKPAIHSPFSQWWMHCSRKRIKRIWGESKLILLSANKQYCTLTGADKTCSTLLLAKEEDIDLCLLFYINSRESTALSHIIESGLSVSKSNTQNSKGLQHWFMKVMTILNAY